jgi:hypothetical protein
MSVYKPITPGIRFGRLTVLTETDSYKMPSGRTVYRSMCRCECGTVKFVTNKALRDGKVQSCGCFRNEASSERAFRHGQSIGGRTKIYRIWKGMTGRCRTKNGYKYRIYGSRGIVVCKRWLKFENFYADMGDPPKGCTLDRINNDGPYKKSNCAWRTPKQQARNKRDTIWLTINGVKLPLAEWAEISGVKYGTLLARYQRRSWPVDRLLIKDGRRKCA